MSDKCKCSVRVFYGSGGVERFTLFGGANPLECLPARTKEIWGIYEEPCEYHRNMERTLQELRSIIEQHQRMARTFAEWSDKVDRLKEENERLRKQLNYLRQKNLDLADLLNRHSLHIREVLDTTEAGGDVGNPDSSISAGTGGGQTATDMVALAPGHPPHEKAGAGDTTRCKHGLVAPHHYYEGWRNGVWMERADPPWPQMCVLLHWCTGPKRDTEARP